MWFAVSTPVVLLVATVLMERFERRCHLVPTAERKNPRPVREAR